MSKRKTNKEFISDAEKVHGDKYDYSLVDYINSKIKVKIICKEHGQYEQRPDHHLNGSGCPKCNSLYDTNKFIKKSIKIHGNEYDYSLVKYENNIQKVDIICRKHGKFKQKPSQHIFGQGCPKCRYDNLNYDNDIFIKKSKELNGNKYDYSLVEYKKSYIKVKLICKEHGIFEQKPKDHLNSKQGCPKCKQSKGENGIMLFLNENNIKYITQHKFNECKFKKRLPFDFYLPDYNMCIEYDGKQHYKPIEFFGGEKTLNYIQNNDKIKTEFCTQNNISLLRIKFNDNVNDKLKTLLERK